MRITCEKCKAVYSIAEKIIGPDGRIVKCANCSHTWIVETEAQHSPLMIKKNSISASNNILKTLIALFFCVNFLTILLFFSDSLIQYKPFEYIYKKFSVYNTKGLSIEDISFKTYNDEFAIKGTLSNLSDESRVTPNIRYTLLNKDKQVIFSFTTPSSKDILKAKATWPISTKISNIKHQATYLQIDIGNKLDLFLR